MRFKKYFLVICLIICLFTIASACASEVNDTEISAIDSDDNLEINEDNQVMDNDNGGLSDNASAKDDNGGLPAQQRDENSDSDRLGITDGDLIGDELNSQVVSLNVTVADKPIFVVDCADKFNGNVAIRIGEDKSIYDGSAKALIEADRLPAGNYVATAFFYGDSNYENLTQNNIMFTVSRLTPTIDVNIEDVTYPNTAYANVHVGNYANGTVNVTVNNRIFRGVMSNGEANVALYGLPGGRMNAHIQFFSRDDYNDNVSLDEEFVVFPNNSLITIRCNEISYVGEDIDIYIDTINSTGDLNIYINGVSYGYPVSSNPQINYQVCISDKSEGTYQLDFRLDGDQNYTGYETSKTIHVIKRDLSINLEDIGESIYVDKPVTLKAKLSNTVKGNVIFTINGANYTEYVNNDDMVTHLYTPANNDTLTVYATFLGNDMYNSNASDSMDFNVSRIPTSVDVNFNSPISAGNDANFEVIMNPGINGVVILSVNTKTYYVDSKTYYVAIVDGSGRYTVSNLADDIYDIKAEFEGNDKYAGSISDVKQLFVNKVSTNLTISIDKVSMNYIEEAVVSIVLNQKINAVVTVKVNGNNHTVGLVNGKGSFTLYDLDKGNYIINAVFAGDDGYVGCTSNTLSLTVNGDNISSWVSISLNKPSVFAGDEVTITVNSNPTVTGIIKLNIGSNSYDVAVKRGVGKFTIDDLANGTYDVWAVFEGDNYHLGNSSDVKQLEVKRIPIELSISVDKPSVFVGDEVTITVGSNPAVTGVIKLNIGSNLYNVAVKRGVGKFIIDDLANGTYDVWAVFEGDNYHLGNSSDVKQLEVKRIPIELSISVDKPSVFVGDSVVVGVVLDQSINTVATVNVNGKEYIIGIVNGKGNLTLDDLAFGTYNINATFAGEDKYVGSVSNNTILEVNKIETQLSGDAITVVYNADKYLVISLKDSKGNAIGNVDVTVNLNGAKTLKTDGNGQVKVSTYHLAPNSYNAKIIFKGNAMYEGSSKDVKVAVNKATPKITAKAKTFKRSVKTKKYTVSLNVNQKVKVAIKVNKKTYYAYTNTKGVATFKITKLTKKGKYTATVSSIVNKCYNKAKSVSVKITVK